jgi:hypothetical protein
MNDENKDKLKEFSCKVVMVGLFIYLLYMSGLLFYNDYVLFN